MAQTVLNVGSNANDGTGDTLRSAMISINSMFTELYAASPVTSQIAIAGNEITTNQSNANLKLTANGTGVIELEGIQIRDNHIEGTRSNEDLHITAAGTGNLILGALRVNGTTLSSDDSSAIKINETLYVNTISSDDSSAVLVSDDLNVSGTLSVDTIDTNTISSNDSTTIQINDGLNVTGTLTVDTVDVNNISSTDSSAIQINDAVNISGVLTVAGGITGVTALTRGDISDGEATTSSSSIVNLDTFAVATYRSARYDVSISDTTNSRFSLHTIYVTHDGTNAYINDTSISSTGSSMVTFTADVDSGNVRVRMVPISADSATYKFVRTLINV
jgi:hypothetical protein